MHELLDRYVPTEPFPRLVVAALAAVAGVPAFVYGFFVVVLQWGVQRSIYLGEFGSTLALLLGAVCILVAYSLVRDVAERSEGRLPGGVRSDPVDRSAVDYQQGASRDPVAVLQERYATGELTEEELDRRMERLLELDRVREAADERDLEDLVTE